MDTTTEPAAMHSASGAIATVDRVLDPSPQAAKKWNIGMQSSATRRDLLRAAGALPLAASLAAFPRACLIRAQGSAAYDVIDLGPFDIEVTAGNLVGIGSVAKMNEDGVVCGRIGVAPDRFSPATWSPTGKLRRLESGRAGGSALAIDAGGSVVGIESIDGTFFRPMLWLDGERILLPDLGGSADGARGHAYDLDDDGVITGYVRDGDADRSVRWVDGVAVPLPDPPTGYSASYHGTGVRPTSKINARGNVLTTVARDGAGSAERPTFALWRDDEATILTMPDEVAEGMLIIVTAFNDDDTALFTAGALDGDAAGFFYFTIAEDGTTIIDRRDTGQTSVGLARNNRGDVVGQIDGDERSALAAIWRGGDATDLNTLMPDDAGFRFYRPQTINDVGMIAGQAFDDVGVTHGILLVPSG